jgi:hypothetical protein
MKVGVTVGVTVGVIVLVGVTVGVTVYVGVFVGVGVGHKTPISVVLQISQSEYSNIETKLYFTGGG